MQVSKGDVVTMRDGRTVFVTDAADSHPDAWRTYSYKLSRDENGAVHEEEYISSEMPAETIFIGQPVSLPGLTVNYDALPVVSDMSEVVSILE